MEGKHSSSSRHFLVVNHDTESAQTHQDNPESPNDTDNATKSEPDASHKTSSIRNVAGSKPGGHKRNVFLDARDVYSAYQPTEVLGMFSCISRLQIRFFHQTPFLPLKLKLVFFPLQDKISSARTYTQR